MSETVGDLKVLIGADISDFNKGLSNVMGGIADLGKAVAVGAAAAFVGFGVAAIKSASDAEQGIAQLEARLKSTKGVAGVTKDMALQLASGLQQTTRFSDDATLAGENLLLTFTNIGKDVFPDATSVMLDMSEALGQDVKSSAIQLGKALNDPINGMTALSRVGVSFTEKQKQQIKYFQQTGQLAKAQAVIMKELKTEFGGAAEAAGNTFAGNLDKLKNAFDDILETVGTAMLPALTSFTKGLANVARGVGDGIKNIIDEVQKYGLIGAIQKALFGPGNAGQTVLETFLKGIGFDDTTVKNIQSAVAGFLMNLQGAIKPVQDFLSRIGEALFPTQHGALSGLEQKIFPKDKPTAPLIERLKTALGITPDLSAKIQGAFDDIKTWVTTAWQNVTTAIGTLLNGATEYAPGAGAASGGAGLAGRIMKLVGISATTQNDISIALNKVVDWVRAAWTTVSNAVINLFAGEQGAPGAGQTGGVSAGVIVSRLLKLIGISGDVQSQISGAFTTLVAQFSTAFADVKTKIVNLVSGMGGGSGPLSGMEKQMFSQAVGGETLIDRIKKMLGITPEGMAALSTIADLLLKGIKDLGEGVKGFFASLQGIDPSGFVAIHDALAGLLTLLGGGVAIVAAIMMSALGAALPLFGTAIKGFFDIVKDITSFNGPKLLGDILSVMGKLNDILKTEVASIIDGVANAILKLLGLKGDFSVLQTLQSLLDKITTAAAQAKGAIDALTGAKGGYSASQPAQGGNGQASVGVQYTPPGKASGGAVSAGDMYMVNEKTQEFFRPNIGGQILPLGTSGGAGGGGPTIVNVTIVGQQDASTTFDLITREAKRRNLKLGW